MQSIEWNIIRNEKTKYFIYYVENEEIIWSCNLLEKEKNNTKYLYAPRGPVLKNSNFDLINLFLKNIKEWLSIKKYTTLVINPYINEKDLKKISSEYNYAITQNNDYSNIKCLEKDLSFYGSGAILHQLFFENMGIPIPTNPSICLMEQINKDFGSYEKFKNQFTEASKAVEASRLGSVSVGSKI